LRRAQEQACQVVGLEVVVLAEGVANEDVGATKNFVEVASGSDLEGLKVVGPFVVERKVDAAAVAAVGMGIADKLVAVQMPKGTDVDQVEEEALQVAKDLG